jgi:hemoglobin/transferrin/lactoferrin receptor protein
MLCKQKLALTLSLTLGTTSAMATTQDSHETVTQLNEVTVSSTRTERRVNKVPNTVTVIPSAIIEQHGARDIKDVFQDELDVTVRAAPTRFTAAAAATGRAGNEGINIRGLEGNQVLMMVDGIRVPNSFSFGSFSTGRGDFLDVDGIKTVEVLRGPASTQFGSDGLAGAVIFRTLDPSDLLKSEQKIGGFIRSGYASIDRSWSSTLGVAGNSGEWKGMLLGSYRQGHEVTNKGSNEATNENRTAPNPVDYNNQYLLGKAFFTIDPTQKIGLTFETQQNQKNTEVYSARSIPPLVSTSTMDLDTRDHIDRNRVSLSHRFNDVNAPWFQRAESTAYWQDAQVTQLATETRNTAPERMRNNNYRSKVIGFSTLLESNFNGLLNQRVSYGIDWSRAEITGVRDGTMPPPTEVFPARPFPDTTYTLAGAFVQSEIEYGKFSIIPGLRFDSYTLSPSSSGYSGAPPVSLSGQAVTPRLGIVWQLSPLFAPYGQIAKGFRAPTPDQVNNGFSNLSHGYKTIGNPNLKAESADSMELGFRGKIENIRYSVSVFDNRYQDFISLQPMGGSGTPANPTIFQYINLANAHIRGVEVRTEWSINSLWKTNAGAAYSKGYSEIRGVPTAMDSIQPFKAVLGLRYDEAIWGGRANLIYSAGKNTNEISSTIAQFAPPSYAVLDLGIYWKPFRNLMVNANLNNVFDNKYWRWSDVSGLVANSNITDAYTAPGRNVQVSVRYDF